MICQSFPPTFFCYICIVFKEILPVLVNGNEIIKLTRENTVKIAVR